MQHFMPEPIDNGEFVVCAANKHRISGLIICGPRHYDHVMRAAMKAAGGFPFFLNCDQGFVNQRGEFLTRVEAWAVAKRAGQIRTLVSKHEELYSENLY